MDGPLEGDAVHLQDARAAPSKQVAGGVRQLKRAPTGAGAGTGVVCEGVGIGPPSRAHAQHANHSARGAPHQEAAKNGARQVALLRLAGEVVGQGGVVHKDGARVWRVASGTSR